MLDPENNKEQPGYSYNVPKLQTEKLRNYYHNMTDNRQQAFSSTSSTLQLVGKELIIILFGLSS